MLMPMIRAEVYLHSPLNGIQSLGRERFEDRPAYYFSPISPVKDADASLALRLGLPGTAIALKANPSGPSNVLELACVDFQLGSPHSQSVYKSSGDRL